MSGNLATDLRRRRAAADRMTPMVCRNRDPLDCPRDAPGPSTYGLTVSELTAEAQRRIAEGWGHWEVVARLARPVGVDR